MTEGLSVLRSRMVADPEVNQLVGQYKTISGTKDAVEQVRHHEQSEQPQ